MKLGIEIAIGALGVLLVLAIFLVVLNQFSEEYQKWTEFCLNASDGAVFIDSHGNCSCENHQPMCMHEYAINNIH